MAMVLQSPSMPKAMRLHRDCLSATMDLEIELFGEVLSTSIVEPLEQYSWWPFASEPPSTSLSLKARPMGGAVDERTST